MNTQALRNKVLDLAIHGKLVPQDPNDEPAIELLHRIADEKRRLIQEKKLKKQEVNESAIEGPFDIPENWCWCELGTLVNFKHGTAARNNSIHPNSWLLDLEDIEKETGVLLRKKKMAEVNALSDKRPFKRGDVLYSKLRPYLNKVIIADEDGVCTTEILALDFGEVNAKYAQTFLMSKHFVDYVMMDAYGVKMPRADADKCNACAFPLPPLAEQKRIVAEIDRLMKLIDTLEDDTQSIAKTAKQARNLLLDLAIHGKLVPQDPNDEPAIELLRRIADEKRRLIQEKNIKKQEVNDSPIEGPFDIPDSWCWCKLGTLVNFKHGTAARNNSIHPNSWLLDLEDIEKETGVLLRKKKMSEVNALSDKRPFKKGDVLYSKLRPYLNKVIIADEEGFCTTEILALDFGQVNAKYAQTFLMSKHFVDYVMMDAYGVKMPRADADKCNACAFPLPPIAEQKRIVEKLESVFCLLENFK